MGKGIVVEEREYELTVDLRVPNFEHIKLSQKLSREKIISLDEFDRAIDDLFEITKRTFKNKLLNKLEE